MAKKLTRDENLKEFKKIIHSKFNANITIRDEKFSIRRNSVEFHCKKHNHTFNKVARAGITTQFLCPKCLKEEKPKTLRKSYQKFLDDAYTIWGDEFIYTEKGYVNRNSEISIYCKIHGSFSMRPSAHISKTQPQGCPTCGREKSANYRRSDWRSKRETYEAIYPDIDWSRFIYLNNSTKGDYTCNICGREYSSNTQKIDSRGYACYRCEKEKSLMLSQRDFEEDAYEVHGNKFDYSNSKFTKSTELVNIKCNTCGVTFSQLPCSHIHSKAGCPSCKSSKGEELVEEVLKELLINYKREVRLEGCKYKRKLPFDFVLYNSNEDIRGIIEFDGMHHTEPVNFGGGMEKAIEVFEITKEKDLIRNNYCLDNDIPLLRISYTEVEKTYTLIRDFLEAYSLLKNK